MLYYSTERIFSAGGLTVTNLRASLDETKVEAILLVHLNLMKVDKMEKVGKMIKWGGGGRLGGGGGGGSNSKYVMSQQTFYYVDKLK